MCWYTYQALKNGSLSPSSHIDRKLEMMSEPLTNAERQIIPSIACEGSQRNSNDMTSYDVS